jgi:hypothetical protein
VELLKAVNIILPWLEEAEVTSINTRHPTVTIILTKLDTVRLSLLSVGYWFNTEVRKFYPSGEQKVDVPLNLLAFYPEDYMLNYVARDTRFYDLDASTFNILAPFTAKCIMDLPFIDLPQPVADAIVWRACQDVYVPDFGITNSVQVMAMREAEAIALVEREHLRRIQMSSMRTRAGHNFMQALRT